MWPTIGLMTYILWFGLTHSLNKWISLMFSSTKCHCSLSLCEAASNIMGAFHLLFLILPIIPKFKNSCPHSTEENTEWSSKVLSDVLWSMTSSPWVSSYSFPFQARRGCDCYFAAQDSCPFSEVWQSPNLSMAQGISPEISFGNPALPGPQSCPPQIFSYTHCGGGEAPHVGVFGRSRVALLQRVHLWF